MKTTQEQLNIWQTHIEAQARSGLSAEKYCQEHDLTSHKFFYYRTKLKSTTSASRPRFLPARAEVACQQSITVAGVEIKLDPAVNPKWLARIFVEMGKINEVS